MEEISDRLLAAHASLNYTSPDALKDDPLNQQILNLRGLWQRWRLAVNMWMMGRVTRQ